MEGILTFFSTHSNGMLVLFSCFAATIFFIQWVAWIFCFGRFSSDRTDSRTGRALRHVLGDLLVKIIDDFRHLLALIIVLIFAVALGYTVYRAGSQMSDITNALQTVVATLGGLVGSLVGYYFGEAAAKRSPEEPLDRGIPEEPVQQPPARVAPPPPQTP